MGEPTLPTAPVTALSRGGLPHTAPEVGPEEARELCELCLSLREGRPPRWVDSATVAGSLGLGLGGAWALITQEPAVVVAALACAFWAALATSLVERRRPVYRRLTEMGIEAAERGRLLNRLDELARDRRLQHLGADERATEMARRLLCGRR